ncbi:inositol monophosphatase family protein [uncultured Draconibacterium sp.]|uniref:3'(2'),5'-bisphosphate nucleotidase CysQ family protein n=1 Tax=uncultured Draconibacterium sp. TaxID=1573823 RepID=UPI0025F987C9|nr:inositol monophosphatase family protein [uncultured Draconibacterium sp.]
MQLSSTQLSTLCQYAITAAKKAGGIIHEYAGKKVKVGKKIAADSLASQVVTAVDIKAQNCILETLAPTIREYQLALLSEESPDNNSRFLKDYFWCIDPMDGTLAFTEQTPGYAVSIALVAKSGEPQLGVVFDPLTQNLYHAVKDQGAFLNLHPWQPDLQLTNKNTFTLHIDRTFLQDKHFNLFVDELKTVLKKYNISKLNIQKHAGAVLNAIWVLEQAPGCYFKLPKATPGGGSLWDFAATACIFNEVGAVAKSFDDSLLDLNRKDSSFMNHRGVLYSSNQEIATLIRQFKSLARRNKSF